MSTLATLARRHSWLPPLIVLLLLGAIIGILRPSTFTGDQINIKIAAAMTLILIATGETIVVTRGGIDLSIGGILSLTTAICATRGDPGLTESVFWIGFVLALGAIVGVVNGLIITFGRLQPFVVTLATWSILEGCALTVLPAETSGVPKSWVDLEHAMPFGIGVPMILLGILIVLWAWFSRTRVYNEIRAAGSNERSAYLNRVSVLGTNAWAYGLSGFFAAAAGLYFATQTGAGHPTVGTQYVLPAIAAVVIGGTNLMGGRGSLMGTIVGAFILTLIGDVVFLLKLQSYWQWVMSGLILMLVVILTALTESRSNSGNGG
ncbi:MAG TPA: ABC transporter permease [Devosia sp.]|nr:ABC transporter permease [Devosia sp.]